MKSIFSILCFVLLFGSCTNSHTNTQDYEINLKWNKAYENDTFKRSVTGLKWALSYLGSTLANDNRSSGINYKGSIITININALGFSKSASKNLSKLHYIFKNSEDYKKNNSIDLARYVALTFGNSHHYYAIVDVPKSLEKFEQLYIFDSVQGYIDNSSVSKVDRIISFSEPLENNNQGFISSEVDSISKAILEYETMEVMPNGQLRFGIYDEMGELKDAANNSITRAGKPAKCIWCHEVVVQPLFRQQQNHEGYLSYMKFSDTLKYFNHKLQNYQDSKWKDKNLLNKKLHTKLELLYISFMEPNAERISREWNMPLKEVKQKLSHLKTHVNEEFPFLGNLYHRKDIDKLAPFHCLEVPDSIREKSTNEVNLLK